MTSTGLLVQKDKVLITRFIDRKLYKVEFSLEVLAKDLEDYFNISDWTFQQVARPCEVLCDDYTIETNGKV